MDYNINIDITDIEQKVSNDDDMLALVIFGSSVKSTEHRDIDICLFSYPERLQKDTFIKKKNEYKTFMNKYDLSFFDDLPLYIKARVVKEGKIIIDKDYDVLFDIYLETIKDFALFQPHFNTFLQAVKNG